MGFAGAAGEFPGEVTAMKQQLKAWLRQFAPRAIRPQRILAGPLRGARLVTSWHDYPAAILGTTERQLLLWFAGHVQPGETWLDIGAHYGYTALALGRCVGSAGRVFAFEPMVTTAGYLAETRRLNRLKQLQILPMGLGAPETLEVQQLPIVRGMVDSTVDGTEWRESILVARLDWLWPAISNENLTLDGIKIDVQGMEVSVLRGALGLLQHWQPKLVIELHAGVDRQLVLALLQEAGYLSAGEPIEPLPSEMHPEYYDNRSYSFEPAHPLTR